MRIYALDKLRWSAKDLYVSAKHAKKRQSEDQLFPDVDSQLLNVWENLFGNKVDLP